MIQGILGGIGAISLLVAALGITNTMIMSIYERTKEIGIMKVIGANLEDIRKMFLLEAGMIGFIGGVAGIIISYILSLLMNTVLSIICDAGCYSEGTTGSSFFVGCCRCACVFYYHWDSAGYSPARRAMRLPPSLKNE